MKQHASSGFLVVRAMSWPINQLILLVGIFIYGVT